MLRRIQATTAVRDTDRIPKVPDAGQVRDHNGVSVQVMHCGILVEQDGYYGGWMTEVIRRLRGHHEPQEEAVFYELIERMRADTSAPVMVELGSYWAYYSLWLKNAFPAATCVMVEPDRANLEVGRRNFELNGVEGRFIRAAAGGDHGSTMNLRSETGELMRQVPVVSVDGLMADERLGRVDVLLCDAQGAELEVLRGAGAALAEGKVRFLCVSTHMVPHDPAMHQRCLGFLERLGAHVIAEHSIPESCGVDGLIVASLDPRDHGWTVDITIGRARDSEVGELEWRLARTRGWRGLMRHLARPLLGHPRVRAAATRLEQLLVGGRSRWARG